MRNYRVSEKFKLTPIKKNAKRTIEKMLRCMRGLISKMRKRHESESQKEREHRKDEDKDFIFSSSLKYLYKRYKIDFKDDSSFFNLREALYNDGKEYVKKELKRIIVSPDIDSMEKADLLCRRYDEIIKNRPKIQFKWEEDDFDSPKIYYTAVEKYLKELGWLESGKKNFKKVLPKVLQKIYEMGIETELEKIKINREYLEKYKNTGDIKNIELEIERIKEKLNSH